MAAAPPAGSCPASACRAANWRSRCLRVRASAPSRSRALSAAKMAMCSAQDSRMRPGSARLLWRNRLSTLRRLSTMSDSQRLSARVCTATWMR
ncbi:Uncharacterised protein [Bordetella pertussis]|nr:Uncharacterised protein [Bordetella pertussis]